MAELGDLSVRAASVVGKDHRRHAEPRQDAFGIGRDDHGRYLLLALADGLGSSARSEIGAAAAAEAAVAVLRDRTTADFPLNDNRLAVQVFAKVASQMLENVPRWLDAADIGTVLMTAVVEAYPQPDGSRAVWLAWLGDVSAWVLSGGRWSQCGGDAKAGGDGPISNAVCGVLPQQPHLAKGRALRLGTGQVLALVSDGVGDALEQAEGQKHFAEWWSRPPSIAAFVNQVSYEARAYVDDRTAVVVWTDPERWLA